MVRVYLAGNPAHDLPLQAFYDGCSGEKELVEGFKYEPSEIAVIFGVYKSRIKPSWPRGKVFRQQRQNKLDVIVLETGYVNRGDGENRHYAAGFNGLNGRADFRNKSMGPERWDSLKVQLRPYSRGENILLCGQVPWDGSVDHIEYEKWLNEMAKTLQSLTTRPIVFRPHPLVKLGRIQGCGYSTGPLEKDLETAHCVVTFNSNTGVDALIYGKPVFAFDEGSMYSEIANKNLKTLESPTYYDRKQWANNIAFSQWTPAEMREGKTWQHLTRA